MAAAEYGSSSTASAAVALVVVTFFILSFISSAAAPPPCDCKFTTSYLPPRRDRSPVPRQTSNNITLSVNCRCRISSSDNVIMNLTLNASDSDQAVGGEAKHGGGKKKELGLGLGLGGCPIETAKKVAVACLDGPLLHSHHHNGLGPFNGPITEMDSRVVKKQCCPVLDGLKTDNETPSDCLCAAFKLRYPGLDFDTYVPPVGQQLLAACAKTILPYIHTFTCQKNV